MKNNYVHVCFVIDESGSMSGTESDVIGGFKKVVDEQRENKEGTCSVSYYKFNSKVSQLYKGKDINDVKYIDKDYSPGGCTALFDAVGTAIDEIGKWLNDMDESQRPEKNLIVIMTDGLENASTEYSAQKVKDMIKEQEDKYNWSFVYMGSDIRDANDANSLGFSTKLYSSKMNYMKNYDTINASVSAYRCCTGSTVEKNVAFNLSLNENCESITREFAEENGLNADELLS